jgi:hypothetical protein
MADDSPEDTVASPDPGRVKRAPPTIDLEASEVSDRPQEPAGDAPLESKPWGSKPPEPDAQESEVQEPKPEEPGFQRSESRERPAAISPWVIAPFSGVAAAALVIGVGWMLGWPAVQPPAPAAPQVSAAAIDDLTARLASVEAKVNKSAAPDQANAARMAALEKSFASLRDELSATRGQSDKLAAQVNGLKSAPGDPAPAVDMSAINERLDQLERTARADDVPLRRVVVASLLDVSVRQGDPFVAMLSAAKSLAPEAVALKPLEGFAASGVPTAATLSRELLTLVPKLSPPAQENDVAASGLIDRLQAGASRLVRIERTDAVGNDRGAVVARATAAALRNDANEARRELNTLPTADRAAAQSWIDKADARDAALAASRQFAADAMTALAKPAQ